MSTVDKLIADRGHGLSPAQRGALCWLASNRTAGRPPRYPVTWQSLRRLGLVAVATEPAIGAYELTDDGRCLALRMGLIELPPNTDGSPGDLYDPPPLPRLPCGSLRHHDMHQWVGQSYGRTYTCPGVAPINPERARIADRRLREENAGLTDHWRES